MEAPMDDAARAATGRPPLFRILGPVEVAGASGPLHVPSGRRQVILAMLLLDANRVVSIEQLIDAVWDEDPPSTARSQVQICVSALRRTLAELGAEPPIVTRAPGYLLLVPDDQVDRQLFEDASAQSAALSRQGRPAEAAAICDSISPVVR
jgi:DNA-binding SARP family transcriptional activator